MSFTIQGRLLISTCCICQRVFRIFLHAQGNTLSIHDVDGCTRINGRCILQRKTIEFDGCLIRTSHIKLTIVRRTRQRISNLARLITYTTPLVDIYVRPTNGRSDVLCDVSRHSHFGGCTLISHFYGIVRNGIVVNIHIVHLREREHLINDCTRLSIRIVHVSTLRGRESVCHITLHHIQRLCHHRHRHKYDGKEH